VGSYGIIGGKAPHILVPVLDGGKLASSWVCAINELRERTYRLELGESGLSIFCSEEQNTINLSDKIYSSKDRQILINLEFYRQVFEKYSRINFRENSSCNRFVSGGQQSIFSVFEK
jgi:hypothetical protein